MNYSYHFPVVRGKQANREYYIAMVPLKMISKLFPEDEEYVPPEFRAQRKLNEGRVPVIAKYILNNRDSYVFSALASSIDGDFSFESDNNSSDTGMLNVSMDARFLINDGQHRKAAIIEALKEDQSLGEETIPIVFFEDKGLARSQQIFTDLNKNAVKTSNSISELYDSRDSLAVVTRKVIQSIEFLNSYTDKEKDNLGKYSSNIFTLNTFYSANNYALGKKDAAPADELFLKRFWSLVVEHMPQWQEIMKKEVSKVEIREKYIVTQGVVIQALGLLANSLKNVKADEMENYLIGLETINWKRSARIWLMRAVGQNGRIITNKKAVSLISNQIKKSIGIPLSSKESKLERELKEMRKE
ncbi:DNA sulfur modification protein DndB [Erysipelotrichaceae bacterium Oil+RF-744-GAM-WT-6]|uniref:DNA sulfur modification protein DndB n=1 Tax=Stecheria intestinalis TaxID=2606630 RepID=A0A7X2NRV9_9FIRM|nr:DNA sulfur modification protein DndB [Stecheria intestinalis]MSS58439.1 DNA sulfur modification protein DndB [Stecheria intestinalis]